MMPDGMRTVWHALRRVAAFVLLLCAGCLIRKVPVYAVVEYENPDTGYVVILEDDAELLTEEQREALAEQMQGITEWGNAAFQSILENETSTAGYIERYYRELFGTDSGTVFLIDMDNRNIWIKNNGAISGIITDAYSDTITDNSYRYATKGDYYGCASEVFSEIQTVLSGNRIARPMKYVSNALLALILAVLINYGIMRAASSSGKPTDRELLKYMKYHCEVQYPQAKFVRQTKRYDPVSSDSGSSGGGSSGGGGGSSGSGGGHSF